MIVNLLKILLAAFIGSFFGMMVAMCMVSGFAAIILVPVFNVYYAAIFFFIGSMYSYKIIKKNQIQMDFVPQQNNDKKRPDRFHRGASDF